jgi:hypothetical protein
MHSALCGGSNSMEALKGYAKEMPNYNVTAEEVKKFPLRRTIEMREFATYNNLKFIIWGRPRQ